MPARNTPALFSARGAPPSFSANAPSTEHSPTIAPSSVYLIVAIPPASTPQSSSRFARIGLARLPYSA